MNYKIYKTNNIAPASVGQYSSKTKQNKTKDNKMKDNTKKYVILAKHDWEKIGRIKALRSFGDVVEGEIGGFVEKEENLSHDGDCWIYDTAKVFDDANISGNAKVFDDAKVYGYAHLSDYARVYHSATVYGYAHLSGHARVYNSAKVFGAVDISGDCSIQEMCEVRSIDSLQNK